MKNIQKDIEIRRFLEWCLKKKSEQIEDITKKERFDVTKDLPIKIFTQR